MEGRQAVRLILQGTQLSSHKLINSGFENLYLVGEPERIDGERNRDSM